MSGRDRRSPAGLGRLDSTRDVAKFAAAVGLLGIFWDAAVGHALTWENDPYWTYWVTKTFLIATVFGVGTALLGVGVGRGAVITAVHTLVLTVYYWTLSPIGLPSHPRWLDLEHTWETGLPIHFGVIYLGYLSALWLWRRREQRRDGEARREALVALGASVAIVALAGGGASLAVGEWPGATYFVIRLLITFPFLLLWWSLAGRDWQANVAGAVILAFFWASYGEYVSPVGLPNEPLRVFDEAPPPADPHWLDYREQWLISLPIYLIASAAILIVAGRFPPGARAGRRADLLRGVAAAGAALALLIAPLAVAAVWIDAGGEEARITAGGSATVERGEWFSGEGVATPARLTLFAEDRVRKITPLPPHDRIDLKATVPHADGRTYEVSVDTPLVEHPAGRHGTWGGVGIDVWHHGESGVGSEAVPPTLSELAAFGIGEVSAGGRTIARGLPVHVMTGSGDDRNRLDLHVGDQANPVPSLPDGHLRVVWADYSGGVDRDAHAARYASGTTVLVVLLVLAGVANVPRRGSRST